MLDGFRASGIEDEPLFDVFVHDLPPGYGYRVVAGALLDGLMAPSRCHSDLQVR
jgi:hypothetical protein